MLRGEIGSFENDKAALACAAERGVDLAQAVFVQAEDGIRDYKVTGVQTCALPISNPPIMHNAFPALAYDWNAARVTTVLGVGLNGATSVTLALNGAGDSVYLPYGQGEVHSVRLPGPGPAAAGVTCFITAGMSGCRLYVDR